MIQSGRILALDYGTKKVGVAPTDPLQITASPYTTIRYEERSELLSQLRELIADRDVVEIVIGVPVGLGGKDTKFTTTVRKFIDWFREQVTQPVHMIDERFSSAEAKETLIQMGVKTGHNKEKVDAMAAAHLLRFYLDVREQKGRSS